MHVLTKIFIVLVALLSVMLVPLVVVYAKNEDSYKAKYVDAQLAAAAANTALNRAQVNHGVETARLQGDLDALRQELGQARAEVQAKNGEIAGLKSDLTVAQTQYSQIISEIKTMASTSESAQTLINQLVTEARELRLARVDAERRNAELTAAMQEQGRQLEVAESAVRALQEEMQRLSEAEAEAVRTIAAIQEQYPQVQLDSVQITTVGEPIDRKVFANVVDVRDVDGVIIAEIDAGQRDGIKEGWSLILSDGQGHYVGRLRILSVDLNRATGVAEDAAGNPVVPTVGNGAYALPQS